MAVFFDVLRLSDIKNITPEMESKLKEFLDKHKITDLSLVAYDLNDRQFQLKCVNHIICKNWTLPEGDLTECEMCYPRKYVFEEGKKCCKCDKEDVTCVLLHEKEESTLCDYKLCISCFSILKHGTIIIDKNIFPYDEKLWYDIYDLISYCYLKEYNLTKEEFKAFLLKIGYLDGSDADFECAKEILDLYCVENMIEKYPLLKDYLDNNKKWEEDCDRERALTKKKFKCPKCYEEIELDHIPEILPLYADKGRDLVYEEENKIQVECNSYHIYHNGINHELKCKNYKLCQNTINLHSYKNHYDYLCENCRDNFGGDPPSKGYLVFKESISCPVCLEDDVDGASLPRCDHCVCLKCMRKCFFREDYPPFPIDDPELQRDFEFNYKYTRDNIDFIEKHPELLDYYNTITIIDFKFKKQNITGNLKLCPLCRA